MIKQAIKKGDFVQCEIKSMKGRIYQIVDFDDFIYLVDVEKIADGTENLSLAAFWRCSPAYFNANFSEYTPNEPTTPANIESTNARNSFASI